MTRFLTAAAVTIALSAAAMGSMTTSADAFPNIFKDTQGVSAGGLGGSR